MKTCTKCRTAKEASEFYRRAISPDGLALVCKPCASAVAREIYQRDKQPIKEKALSWALANPERRKEIRQKSADKHRDERRADGRRYEQERRKADPDEARARGRRYTAIRRSREAGNGGKVSQADWDALFEIFEFKTCLYCGRNGCKLVMDHFLPVVLGGRTEVGNLLPVCRRCNGIKNAKHPKVWLDEASFASISAFLAITKDAADEHDALGAA